MLEVGQVFKKNGNVYCLLDLIKYNNNDYAFFSVENDKMSFVFYKILINANGYELIEIKDENLNFNLLEIVEGRIE